MRAVLAGRKQLMLTHGMVPAPVGSRCRPWTTAFRRGRPWTGVGALGRWDPNGCRGDGPFHRHISKALAVGAHSCPDKSLCQGRFWRHDASRDGPPLARGGDVLRRAQHEENRQVAIWRTSSRPPRAPPADRVGHGLAAGWETRSRVLVQDGHMSASDSRAALGCGCRVG